MLLYGMTESEWVADLMNWAHKTPGLHQFVPDAHRLSLEHWIWSRRDQLKGRVMDVGVESRRAWIGPDYFTFGFNGCDVTGDLLDIPLEAGSVDGVLLTEVLEHCENPFRAVAELHRVMRPGGTMLVTSPFFWPDHRTDQYPDFWRFTEQAWLLLLKDFTIVSIEPSKWTDEGYEAYELMRRFECMGMRGLTRACTGYLIEAKK
jgi:SAM-dependent methyltransferase